MPRIEPVDPNNAPEEVAQPLEQARQLDGQTVNLHRELANSMAAIQGYVGLKGPLAEGTFLASCRRKIRSAAMRSSGSAASISSTAGRVAASRGRAWGRVSWSVVTARRSCASNRSSRITRS